MRITEFFKSIFDEILKNNLNKFIIDYVDEKNISLDELSSSTVDNYLFSKIPLLHNFYFKSSFYSKASNPISTAFSIISLSS